MDTDFPYRNGALHAEDVPLPALAAAVGTPFYVYSTAHLARRHAAFTAAMADAGLRAKVCFAVKANGNLSVLRTLARLGAGMDVVSGGELRRALAAGARPDGIVFSGVGKTAAEMELAIRAGILQLNVESAPELEQLGRVAAAVGPVDIAIRVNPDVDAGTHEKIATGRRETKFGVEMEDAPALFARAAAMPHVRPVSVAVHIGSQLTGLEPFRAAFTRVAALARALMADGIPLRRLDLGGGLGVAYGPDDPPPPTPAAYAAMARDALGGLDLPLIFEPGRYIAANAGKLVTAVIYEKQGRARRFVIVDAAMNDLIRPTLYGGRHPVEPVRRPEGPPAARPATVVGPVCETGDILADGAALPPLGPGDLLAIGGAGAYGAVMASTYNARPLVPEVLVSGGDWAVVRPRPALEDVLAGEPIAKWLRDTP